MTSSASLILATPTDCEIVLTRIFTARRQRVFEAYTTPASIRRWLLGPDGWSMPVCEVDAREGGLIRYVWRNDSDGREFGLTGTYREIVPPERIVHVERFDDPGMPGSTAITTTFDEQNGRTTVTMAIRYESREARDLALQSGMQRGIAASYDRLSNLFGPAADI